MGGWILVSREIVGCANSCTSGELNAIWKFDV